MKNTLKSNHTYKRKGDEKRMKHHRIMTVLGTTVFALTTLTFIASTSAKEDVFNTKHNLSANPNIVGSGTPTTTEVCIYCHTPHGGRTDVGGTAGQTDGSAPLGNKAISSANYNMYESPNFDPVANNQGAKPLGVSQACLSCHDGTVAFDTLINAPGSGGYNAATFSGSSPSSLGHNLNGPLVDQNDNTFNETTASPFPNLGTDLRNDHPISMEICNGTTAHDPQFDEACAASVVSGNILKISRTGNFANTDIRDAIRAYKSSATNGRWFVECASCHNPHEASRPGNANGPYLDKVNSRFLRLPSVNLSSTDPAIVAINNGDRNAGSLLCLSCHQK